MGNEDYQYEGKSVLEAHGYKCEYRDNIAYVYAPQSALFPQGETFAVKSVEKTKYYLFNILAVHIAKLGEPFSGWSESLPVVLKVDGVYKRWEEVYGKGRSDDG